MDGHKYTFNAEGTFTLLRIPPGTKQKELNIQVRLERYPDRTVDFGMYYQELLVLNQRNNSCFAGSRHIYQDELVRPTNGTVITGIALQEEGMDRVQIIIRKDTRRFKYRTNIIVDGKLRYFDTMWIQRYDGNSVQKRMLN